MFIYCLSNGDQQASSFLVASLPQVSYCLLCTPILLLIHCSQLNLIKSSGNYFNWIKQNSLRSILTKRDFLSASIIKTSPCVHPDSILPQGRNRLLRCHHVAKVYLPDSMLSLRTHDFDNPQTNAPIDQGIMECSKNPWVSTSLHLTSTKSSHSHLVLKLNSVPNWEKCQISVEPSNAVSTGLQGGFCSVVFAFVSLEPTALWMESICPATNHKRESLTRDRPPSRQSAQQH